MSRVLAIDYGLKRVGIAVTDPLRIIASPLAVVDESHFKKWLQEYINSEQVGEMVLGYPLKLDGTETDLTKNVLALKTELIEEYPDISISLVDERLTSKMAKQSLLDSGVPKMKRKQKGSLDSVSASLILQTYLSMK